MRFLFRPLLAAALGLLPLLALAQAAAGGALAQVGQRAGASFQVYAGSSAQVYRICKAGSTSADDCGVEVLVGGRRAALLERQSATACSCADVEGNSIEIRPLPAAGGSSCGATAQTLWYDNLRHR